MDYDKTVCDTCTEIKEGIYPSEKQISKLLAKQHDLMRRIDKLETRYKEINDILEKNKRINI